VKISQKLATLLNDQPKVNPMNLEPLQNIPISTARPTEPRMIDNDILTTGRLVDIDPNTTDQEMVALREAGMRLVFWPRDHTVVAISRKPTSRELIRIYHAARDCRERRIAA
jgi:hypothetical protein